MVRKPSEKVYQSVLINVNVFHCQVAANKRLEELDLKSEAEIEEEIVSGGEDDDEQEWGNVCVCDDR